MGRSWLLLLLVSGLVMTGPAAAASDRVGQACSVQDPVDAAYLARIEAIRIELGIPKDYAQRNNMRVYPEGRGVRPVGHDNQGRVLRLEPVAARAWRALVEVAAADGIVLEAVSGYRSVRYQQELIEAKLERGQSIEHILRVNTAPGYSEHHTGCALDVTTPGSEMLQTEFAETPAYAWLQANAARFGFVESYPAGNTQGIDYEPWHWCYQPPASVQAATGTEPQAGPALLWDRFGPSQCRF